MLNDKECWICGATEGLEVHHCLQGKFRQLADEDGLTVYLCHKHHTGSMNSAHKNIGMRKRLSQLAQMHYLETHTFEEWMQRYGKNYLDTLS